MALWANDHLPSADRITIPGGDSWLERPTGPTGHYQLGCYYATRSEPDHDTALRHLRFAAEVPRLSEWIVRDPQLRSVFAEHAAYRAAFYREPSQDVLSLATLKPFEAKLNAAGISDPYSLRRYLASPRSLPQVVGPDPTVARQVLATARLLDGIPEGLERFRVEMCREVLERCGPNFEPPLDADPAAVLAEAVTESIAAQCTNSPDRSEVLRWLTAPA